MRRGARESAPCPVAALRYDESGCRSGVRLKNRGNMPALYVVALLQAAFSFTIIPNIGVWDLFSQPCGTFFVEELWQIHMNFTM